VISTLFNESVYVHTWMTRVIYMDVQVLEIKFWRRKVSKVFSPKFEYVCVWEELTNFVT